MKVSRLVEILSQLNQEENAYIIPGDVLKIGASGIYLSEDGIDPVEVKLAQNNH